MSHQHRKHRWFVFALFATAFAFAGLAQADDPPARVARLGYMNGAVSFSPAGENDWVLATLNRPLVTGDRLWADPQARAELRISGSAFRLGGDTGVTLLNVDDRVSQLQLVQGVLNVRVRRLGPSEFVEIDTPNLAFTIRQPGDYRIAVDTDGNSTTVLTRSGRAEVYGEGAAYVVDSSRSYVFYGTGLRDYETIAMPAPDAFDQWALERDRRWERSISSRYVSEDVIGYEDLDQYGTWRTVADYGNVWFPTRYESSWQPYRAGHWAWVEPWGWTWIDDAPFGFAVSHYGRWAYVNGAWGWCPGPVRTSAVYAPALVAFVGGSNFSLSLATGGAGIAWFPLGPRDVYRPAYAVSREYFTRVNVSNTVINSVTVNNYYENRNVTNVTYVNQRVPNAVVAVPTTAFVQSQPVQRAAVRVSTEQIVRAPVSVVPAVAPVAASVHGNRPQGRRPPETVIARQAVVAHAPPPAPVAFAQRQQLLAANPGKPIDTAELNRLRPQGGQQDRQHFRVATAAQTAAPASAPPAQAPEKGAHRGERGTAQAPGTPGAAPGTPPQAMTPPPAPPPQAATPDQRRAQREQEKAQREQERAARAGQPPGAAPQAARPPGTPPQAMTAPPPTPPQAATPDQRRAQREQEKAQREQERAARAGQPPGAAPQAARPPGTPPQAMTAPPATPPQAAAPPDQRRAQREQEKAQRDQEKAQRDQRATQQQQQQQQAAAQRQAEQQAAQQQRAAQQQQQQQQAAAQRQAEQQAAQQQRAAQQQQQQQQAAAQRQAEQQAAAQRAAQQQQQQQQAAAQRQAEQQAAQQRATQRQQQQLQAAEQRAAQQRAAQQASAQQAAEQQRAAQQQAATQRQAEQQRAGQQAAEQQQRAAQQQQAAAQREQQRAAQQQAAQQQAAQQQAAQQQAAQQQAQQRGGREGKREKEDKKDEKDQQPR